MPRQNPAIKMQIMLFGMVFSSFSVYREMLGLVYIYDPYASLSLQFLYILCPFITAYTFYFTLSPYGVTYLFLYARIAAIVLES